MSMRFISKVAVKFTLTKFFDVVTKSSGVMAASF